MSLVVVVTGGTGALGHAVVRHLLSIGNRVAVPFREAASFDDLRRAVGASDDLWGAPADLGDAGAAHRFVEEAARWGGRLDGLAHLAGGYEATGRLEEAPVAEWESMLRLNLTTAYTTCRGVLPHLLKTGGSIVTVSSRLASSGGGGAVAYAASKAAVEGLTRALAHENRQRGVRANVVAPSVLDTEANRRAMPDADRTTWVPPAEAAQVIAFLLSHASRPLTGAVLPL